MRSASSSPPSSGCRQAHICQSGPARRTTMSFHAVAASPGSTDGAPPVGQRLEGVGLDRLDPPVLGVARRARDVEPPPAAVQGHQRRTLERGAAELLAGHRRDGLEVHAVLGPGDDVGVAAALGDGTAQPVGEVERVVVPDGGRAAGPVAGAVTGRGDRDLVVRTGDQLEDVDRRAHSGDPSVGGACDRPSRTGVSRMPFQDAYFSRELRYSLGVETGTRAPLPRDPGQQRLGRLRGVLRADRRPSTAPCSPIPAAAAEFAESCRRREQDELLIQQPGSNRGTPV